MKYHKPDKTWHVFEGIDDFESFKRNFVFEGKFHPVVPEDVIKSFEIAEYIMAHSYYHYPMYDEALNKTLRTFEMAVKIRCQQLNISLVHDHKEVRSKNKQLALKQLISKLNEAEPGKYRMFEMDSIRELRNVLMHPDQHGFTGVSLKTLLFKLMVLMNKLFIPPNFLEKCSKLNIETNSRFFPQQSQPIVMTYRSNRYLISEVIALTSLPEQESSIHCLFVIPLPGNPTKQFETHKFIPPWTFHTTDIEDRMGTIRATTLDTKEEITFQKSTHPSDITRYQDYSNSINSCSPTDEVIYNQSYDLMKHKEEYAFLYTHLWKSEIAQ